MTVFKVKKSESGINLLAFIQKSLNCGHSAKEIKRRIEANHCTVNGLLHRIASKKVETGDVITWDEAEHPLKKHVFDPNCILYEDDHLLVYNKPTDVASDTEGILTLLKPHGKFLLVHRLDKGTTGALILAKNLLAEKALKDAFKNRVIEKQYIALVKGIPNKKKGVIENYLGKIGGYAGQTLYGNVNAIQGKYAKTSWVLRTPLKGAALIVCFPETGRTHQLRVHLNGIGHPILGDSQYGKIKAARLLLHAYKVIFPHPVTGDQVTILAPIPKDFQSVIHSLS